MLTNPSHRTHKRSYKQTIATFNTRITT